MLEGLNDETLAQNLLISGAYFSGSAQWNPIQTSCSEETGACCALPRIAPTLDIWPAVSGTDMTLSVGKPGTIVLMTATQPGSCKALSRCVPSCVEIGVSSATRV